MSVQENVDVAAGIYAEGICLVTPAGVPYIAGGSSPGTGLSDIVCTDNTATTFLARDNGTAITYVTFAGLSYTPTGPVKSSNASAANQAILQTAINNINTNIPAQGMATMAHSLPMVMASDSPPMPMMVNDGVNTASVLKGSTGSSTTQNALLIAGSRFETTLNFNSGTSTYLLDVGNYAWISLALLTNGTPVSVSLTISNDGNLFTPFKLLNDANQSSSAIYGTSVGVLFEGAIKGRYLKFVSTGYTGSQGAYAAIECFSQGRTSTSNVASTYDNQIAANTSLTSIATSNSNAAASLTTIATSTSKTGQMIMANSMPMNIASDQSPIAVAITRGQLPSSGSVPVVVASDQTLAVLVNNSVAAPANVSLAKGQQTMASSIPVVISSDQTLNVLVNNSVAAPVNVTQAKGQAAMASSVPVTIASNQSSIPTYINGYSFKQSNFNVNTSIPVKASAGVLHNFIINNPGAQCQAVLYDGTSSTGTIIGYVNLSLGLATLTYDCAFSTGLFIQFNVASGSAYSSFTVSYQ